VDEQSLIKSEPRAHHHSPQCWLAGFTDSGKKDGRLFVTDLALPKQWLTTPPNAGHRRDFYRVDDSSSIDPVFFEKAFGQLEDVLGPILRSLYTDPRDPNDDELDTLLNFIAIQHMRTPAFRPWFLRLSDSIYRSMISKSLKSREAWEQHLTKAGIPLDSPGADYEGMLKFEREVIKTGQYTMTAENEFYLVKGFKLAVEATLPSLRERFWTSLVSPSGSFVGSDSPVMLDGPKGMMVGFKNADFVLFPVNRFVLLAGTKVPVRPPFVNRRRVARHNSFTMALADRQIYSHVPDFCWLDADRQVRNDWESFSKETLLQSV
jgi:hypothetical protein